MLNQYLYESVPDSFFWKVNKYKVKYVSSYNFTHEKNDNFLVEKIKFSTCVLDTNENKILLKLRAIANANKRKQNLLNGRASFNAMRVSCNRSICRLNQLFDCNNFNIFLTLTNDKILINREDDNVVRKKLKYFLANLYRKFPDMYYICVPEYHEKGCLHFHLVLGGINYEKLRPVFRGNYHEDGSELIECALWKFGRSDLQKVESSQGCNSYLAKYLKKYQYDLRFFNKRRFTYGGNIKKPLIHKVCLECYKHTRLQLDFNIMSLQESTKYLSPDLTTIEMYFNSFNDTIFADYINFLECSS